MSPDAFPALSPADLPILLSDPHVLILDIRPHNAYANARLPGALSLSVPSTLLKRPMFSLARLAPMLPSSSARSAFSCWPSASRILVYDADAPTLADRPALHGLLSKFRIEGFPEARDVLWLQGGLNAVFRERPELLDCIPLADSDEEEDGLGEIAPPITITASAPPAITAFPSGQKALRTKGLPASAFTTASTMGPPRSFRGALAAATVSSEGVSVSLYASCDPLASTTQHEKNVFRARSGGGVERQEPTADGPPLFAALLMQQVPPTPAASSSMADPFMSSTAVPPTPGPSSLANRRKHALSTSMPGSNAAAFDLRLPGLNRAAAASAPGLQPQTSVPSGIAGGAAAQAVVPDPEQDRSLYGRMAGASSMPTLSLSPGPGGFGMAARGMHHSVPGVRQVAFNPFFDAIRQNLELARGSEPTGTSGKGAGIALRLPRRVRRRVGDLPFEWLRDIARRSGRARESTSSSDSSEEEQGVSDEEGKKAKGRRLVGQDPHMSRHAPPPRLQLNLRATELRSTTPPASPPTSPHPSPRATRPTQFRPHHPHTHGSPDHLAVEEPLSQADQSSSTPTSSVSQSPPSAEELTRALEMQFYRIELGEQRRLMGVMEHHSMESAMGADGEGGQGGASVSAAGVVPNLRSRAEETESWSGKSGRRRKTKEREEKEQESEEEGLFPFSITAGLEKGNKNRYRNIWPFEHARVRLVKARPEDDDYMNASYVQPLGTTKRYIATQGPLAATFTDFWTLCWEQNVHVIVMLTREIESNTVKCGKYWADGEYGPLRLKLLATDDTPERERRRRESEMNAGFFGAQVAQKPKHRSKRHVHRKEGHSSDSESRDTVRRVFQLKHTGYPDAPPRIVTQLQYLDWPDFNVPDDPRGVLQLIREVEQAVARSRTSGDRRWGEGPIQPGPWPAPFVLPTPSPPKSDSRYGHTVVEGAPGHDNEVEPTTGIARHALGNPPVLLHCSAGVGRTGGFIAVDAVLDGLRREMRKRNETQVAGTAPGSASAGVSGSTGMTDSRSRSTPSGSSSRGEPMELDSSPSPPALRESPPVTSTVSELTVPVSVGDNEVHVRVAGFTESVPMEVDEKKEPSVLQVATPGLVKQTTRQADGRGAIASLKQKEDPRTVVPASPELLDEVRRATMFRWDSSSSNGMTAADQVQENGMMNKDWDSSSSDSYPAKSGTGSGSGSGTHSSASVVSPHSSMSPPSSLIGSSTSLSAAMTSKTATMRLGSSSPAKASSKVALALSSENPISANVSSVASQLSLQPPKTDHAERDVASAHVSRLDTWRSEVRPSGSPPREDPRSSSKSPDVIEHASDGQAQLGDTPDQDQDLYFQRRKTFDYAQPRKLHEDLSPPLLSTYDEPIRRVVEDMREQRMSLCQSLRQYVFVHRAVIEGALMIVDDEREKERQRRVTRRATPGDEMDIGSTSVPDSAMDVSSPLREFQVSNVKQPNAALADKTPISGLGHGPGKPLTLKEQEVSRKRSLSDVMSSPIDEHPSVGTAAAISPRSKRGASPTELQKETKLGQVMLTKRPSVKRKSRLSDSDSSAELELGPIAAAR